MRSAIRPGVSPCDCIKYCEKWQSWYCTAPPPEPELTDFHFCFHPQQKGTRIIPLSSPPLAASRVTWLCQSTSQSGHELTLALAGPGLSVFRFWHPGCQLCHILMNLAIISGGEQSRHHCTDIASCQPTPENLCQDLHKYWTFDKQWPLLN